MPKMKSNRAAAKRFRVTGTGLVIRNQCKKRHMLTCKTTKKKRGLRGSVVVAKSEQKRARRLLGF